MEARTVVVTGGTRGIGRVVVKDLAQRGYRVIYTGRGSPGEPIMGEGYSFKPDFYTLDLTQEHFRGWFANKLKSKYGSLYGLVHNAGTGGTYSNVMDTNALRNIFEVNFVGPYDLSARFLANEMLGPGSRIVHMSSQLARVVRVHGGYAAYSASKAALEQLTRVMAVDLGNQGVTVNAVAPGWVETEMLKEDLVLSAGREGMPVEAYRYKLLASLALQRFQKPEEVANVVAFFLSPESAGITGQVYGLSGPEF